MNISRFPGEPVGTNHPYRPPSPYVVVECSCHRERLASYELCCGHEDGRNPNCPVHGDGTRA